MAMPNASTSPVANLVPSAMNLLVLLVIGMLAWWNVQQNSRLTLTEIRANTQALTLQDLSTWNDIYKSDHTKLDNLYTDFQSRTKTIEQLVALMRDFKDLLTGLSVQQITLRESILRIELQTTPHPKR
jgi:hypothetical protein